MYIKVNLGIVHHHFRSRHPKPLGLDRTAAAGGILSGRVEEPTARWIPLEASFKKEAPLSRICKSRCMSTEAEIWASSIGGLVLSPSSRAEKSSSD